MNKADRILEEAKDLARSAQSWADLSNALFDPVNGFITQAYPGRAERQEFLRTRQYKQIRALLPDTMDSQGLVEGATPTKSGRFVVRLPRSPHAALDREAEREEVRLNQLVVAKPAAQLKALTS
jgi:predicted HicB family RNase H-like nuclease